MNVYDSERILQVLEPFDYTVTNDPSNADLILLNTCTVREKAEAKMMSALGRFAHLKEHNPDLVLGVAGCVAQQEGKNLLKKVSYLDLVLGPDNVAKLPALVDSIRKDGHRVSETTLYKKKDGYEFIKASPVNTGRPSAMVTVMKGCNKTCAYCIVPRVRGRELSKPVDEVVAEVERLVASGVTEVMLLGQNVNSYGLDREDKVLFPELLDRVDAVAGLERVRFTTSHPVDCTDELIKRFDGRLPTLCEYFHLPVQSGSNRILDAMRRGYTIEEYLEQVKGLRATCPNIHISTDIIVGFPGETPEDFRETLDLMEAVRFDSVFAFKYSPRKGTTAIKMADGVSESEKKVRLSAVLEIADVCRRERLAGYQGQVVDVLVEGPSKHAFVEGVGPQMTGRTRTNVVVNFPVNDARLGAWRFVGAIAQIEVKRALDHSLYGEVALVQ
jgi:tRNA-2-methylthio-N6-dimethylallyladenosine synthase